MRAGFTVQQTLTPEAAGIIKQAVTLAKRRGHAQVTPLHVANTMLATTTGLLRTACLKSHSHPLQCKALELCFNVALNRLPASSSSPMLGPHSSQQHPSISNALVAAFKRAQAHQRRGSIESQQQPLLAVKIEIEQLIISILDDPSVSRVMREAGFSSTQVKSNVEQAVSLELCSQQTPSPSTKSRETTSVGQIGANSGKSVLPRANDKVRNEDVMSVMESLMDKRRRKSAVIVGECLASVEGVVGGVMERVESGDVPYEGFRGVKFISLPLFSFGSRLEVEQKIGELKCVVKSFLDRGVVLYIGDLKWITDYRAATDSSCYGGHERRNYDYSPVEHMIVELGRFLCGINGDLRFWLLGIATFQTYMRCRTGQPSLEKLWGLYPLTVPAGSLGLSLLPESDIESESGSKKTGNGCNWLLLDGGKEKLTCCADCSAKFETEAQSSRNSTLNSVSTSSSFPSWLKDENTRRNNDDQDYVSVNGLCHKWNSICSSVHRQPKTFERTLTFPSASPSSSTSCFPDNQQNPNLHWSRNSWTVLETNICEPSLRLYISDPKKQIPSNLNSIPNSASSSDIMEMEYIQRFKEFNAENLNTICNALEKKVPWQKDIVTEIAGTVLQCRSGMLRRKDKLTRCNNEAKEETWFFFQGVDVNAKEKIARELAKVVFGSHSSFISIALSSFSSTRADSTEDLRNKRSRDDQSCSYIERFAEAVSINPHRVFMMEDVEQADYCSQNGIKKAIQTGKITNANGEEISLNDAIVILSCESFNSVSKACSPLIRQKSDWTVEETSTCMSLDLNMTFDVDGQDQSIDDIGLLESVDRCIIFKIQEL